MATKIYPEGIRVFSPREGAPDFVKGTVIITPSILEKWVKDNSAYLTYFKGDKQLKLQLLHGNKGLYVAVDTYTGSSTPATDDVPF
jgi:hypothetical protein